MKTSSLNVIMILSPMLSVLALTNVGLMLWTVSSSASASFGSVNTKRAPITSKNRVSGLILAELAIFTLRPFPLQSSCAE